MTLKNYNLAAPSVVILADERDPYVSWQHHLDRTYNLRGGVDIVAPVGTPIIARTAGRMAQMPDDGSAGNSCRFYHRDNQGWADVFSHLSSYKTPKNPLGLNGFEYEAGDIVAYSGDTGGVVQHLHWHLLDPAGIRRNPWDYFTASAPAGGDGIIIIPEETPLMTAHQSFQLSQKFLVRSHWQHFPHQLTPTREENLAQGTGGAGHYDTKLNFYFEAFPATSQIEGRLVLVDAASGVQSPGYSFTVDGSPAGKVAAVVNERIYVKPGSYLYLALRKTAGLTDPVLTLWGADIVNLGEVE